MTKTNRNNYFLNNKTGNNLWKSAKKIIPGGNSILSKRPERYGEDIWPAYFSKSRGCYVWDLDGKKFIDIAQMGIGSSILGYNNSFVNGSVIKAINKGINTTLNCREEYDLAKLLLKLNPFADSVKFARSGGEAMTLAIRLARAYQKKEKIAFCGYHGWFDWYLATNIKNKKNLDGHLLKGLSAKGVPVSLGGTIIPFQYNNIESFLSIIKKKIGIIVMESIRGQYPSVDFIKAINKEVKKRKIILICDEITTGFRANASGCFLKVGLKPDIVVYGKGMGNGFAISAVVGKKKIMDMAQESFISSSNWSERVGFVAALATIKTIKKQRTWMHISKIGKYVKEKWLKIFKKYELNIEVSDFEPLLTMKPNYGKINDYLLTYIIQEMLKKGYLTSSSIYFSYAHKKKIIDEYLVDFESVIKKLKLILSKKQILQKLKTKKRSDSFQRLT